ncbi:MAG: hypothetical protein DCF20_10645, partial [Pseudanabaena sp.]
MKPIHCYLSGVAAFTLSYFTAALSAMAQFVPDATLPANSTVTTNGQVHTINGGTTRGVNLYHSFQDFSVPTNNTAHFNNAAQIQNVLTRVTGNSVSNIDGLIKANGNANLYLLNPNGIAFGANAKFEIGGSFVGSTGSSFKFADGSEFSATNPQAPPLLTLSVSPGLQYGGANPAPINNAGNLMVGKDLTLSGGSVTSTGNLYVPNGNLNLEAVAGDVKASQFQAGTATLSATQDILLESGNFQTSGDLNLLAKNAVVFQDSVTQPLNLLVGGNLSIQGDRDVNVNVLANPNSSLFAGGNVVLRSANPINIDADWNGGGDFRIEKLDGSLGDIYSANDPVFQFGGDVNFGNYNGASLQILAGGSFTAGTIQITGAGSPFNDSTVTLSDGSSLIVNGSTRPLLDIRAGVLPSAFFPSPAVVNGVPTSVNISIDSIAFRNTVAGSNGLVFLTNQFAPNTALFGSISVGAISTASSVGNAGSIVIDSKGDIALTNRLTTFSTANISNGGDVKLLADGNVFVSGIDTASDFSNAGNVTLLSRNGNIDTRAGSINAYAFGLDGGKVTLTAGQDVLAGNIDSTGRGLGSGNDILIGAARSVFIVNGSSLNVSTFGQGNAGNVTITAKDLVSFDNGYARSNVNAGAVGNGGKVSIDARSVSVTNGAQLQSNTFGQGNTGSVTITATDSVLFSGTGNGFKSGLFSVVGIGAVGNGGKVSIDARSVSVTNGAQLQSNTFGQGNTGSVTITATDSVLFSGTGNGFKSGLFSVVGIGAVGNGGKVSIDARSVSVTNGAQLVSSTLGKGNAGNITITAMDIVSFDNAQAFSVVENRAVGNGGNVSIDARSVSVTNGAALLSDTRGQGNAGNVKITATDSVLFSGRREFASGAFSNVSTGAVGNGGNVSIDARSVSVTNGAQLQSTTFGQGNAGSVTITATDSVLFSGSSNGVVSLAASTVLAGAVGNGGNVSIDARSVSVTNGAALLSDTRGQGNAGNVKITATELVLFDNGYAYSNVNAGSKGNGGNVSINAGSVFVTNGAALLSDTRGQGNAGNVKITATDSVLFSGRREFASGAFSNVSTGAVGNGGNVSIDARSVSVTNGAQLQSNTYGKGNAGNITITATDSVLFSGSSNGVISLAASSVIAGAVGNGGNVSIDARSVSVTNGAVLASSTLGQGNAGNITITATDSVLFSGSSNGVISLAASSVIAGAVGNGGNVSIDARSVSVTNGAVLASSTLGQGNAGNITITATDSVLFSGSSNGNSVAASTVEAGAVGDGGNVSIDARFVSVTNGAGFSSSTSGQGNAGNITIKATDSVLFSGSSNGFNSAAFTTVKAGAVGNGGNVSIDARSVSAINGAELSSSTFGQGNAGNVTITARDSVFLSNSKVLSETDSNFGNGGKVEVNAQRLDILNGSQISTSTSSSGNVGAIKILLGQALIVDGVGSLITASTLSGSTGTGGSIFIDPPLVTIANGAGISVSSLGAGVGGDITLFADRLTLLNGAFIKAETASSNGGNINLNIPAILLLRYGSQISTTAGTALSGGNGGNININAGFIVGVKGENSD